MTKKRYGPDLGQLRNGDAPPLPGVGNPCLEIWHTNRRGIWNDAMRCRERNAVPMHFPAWRRLLVWAGKCVVARLHDQASTGQILKRAAESVGVEPLLIAHS